MILCNTRSSIRQGHLSSTAASCAYGQAPCILVLVWDNHFTQADWGAADRLLLGHRRPSHSDGRRTHPEESPNSICGWTSSFLLGRGPDYSTRPVAPRAFPGGLTR